jgi:hypothetical protein
MPLLPRMPVLPRMSVLPVSPRRYLLAKVRRRRRRRRGHVSHLWHSVHVLHVRWQLWGTLAALAPLATLAALRSLPRLLVVVRGLMLLRRRSVLLLTGMLPLHVCRVAVLWVAVLRLLPRVLLRMPLAVSLHHVRRMLVLRWLVLLPLLLLLVIRLRCLLVGHLLCPCRILRRPRGGRTALAAGHLKEREGNKDATWVRRKRKRMT